MTWQLWSLFCVTELALCLTPGPAVLFVVSQALSRGALASLWANGGILAGNTIYFVLSALGLGALLVTTPEIFVAIKWIGAAYLLWLGVTTFFGRGHALKIKPASRTGGPRMLFNGAVLQLANPKALIFFTALLPQFINPHAPLSPQLFILAATSAVIEFWVLAGYGVLAGRAAPLLAAEPRFEQLTNRICGVTLGAVAALTALARF